MKISMFVLDNAMQFNLTPENAHEKQFMELLKEFDGDVTIAKGVDVGMCQGGYVRAFSESLQSTAITIRKRVEVGE